MRAGSDWTPEAIEIVKAMWAQDKTRRQIATAINSKLGTKFSSAAIGAKVARLALPMHNPPAGWRGIKSKRRAG